MVSTLCIRPQCQLLELLFDIIHYSFYFFNFVQHSKCQETYSDAHVLNKEKAKAFWSQKVQVQNEHKLLYQELNNHIFLMGVHLLLQNSATEKNEKSLYGFRKKDTEMLDEEEGDGREIWNQQGDEFGLVGGLVFSFFQDLKLTLDMNRYIYNFEIWYSLYFREIRNKYLQF